MRSTAPLLLFAFLQISARGFAQEKITLSEKNAPLQKVLEDIQQQTSYNIWFRNSALEKTNPVTITIKDALIKQVLDLCFKDQPVDYNIVGQDIVVKRKWETDSSDILDIKGAVIDEKGNPLPGASVSLKGSNRIVQADNKGHFAFTGVKRGAILIISNVGYQFKEIEIKNSLELNIQLYLASNKLDQIQIIGYGTTTDRLSTGSVSTVNSSIIEEQPVTNVLSAIQGRAPGVFVSQSSGLPGSNMSIQIRGLNSIAAGNNPLYVVDGVPMTSTPLNNFNVGSMGANGFVSPFNSLNPADIEQIDILKDADATAIYGSRGANGVVLITTKKAKNNKTSFDFNISSGVGRVDRMMKLLNTPDYLLIRREAFMHDSVPPDFDTAPDLLIWDTTKYTDWQKSLTGGSAHITDVQGSFSGGNSFTNFLLSGNYHREGTVYPGDFGYVRGGGHLNLEHRSANNKFRASVSIIYTTDNNKITANFLGLSSFYNVPPDYPLYDSTGKLNWSGGVTNPLSFLQQFATTKTTNFQSNGTFQYSFTSDFSLKMALGYSNLNMNQVLTFPMSSQDPSYASYSYANFSTNNNQNIIAEPQANYVKTIGAGRLQVLVGSTWQESKTQGQFLQGINYSSDALLSSIAAAGSISLVQDQYSDYKYLSLFSRATYNWKNRYIINGSFRRDGSSRFGEDRQYGNFGALGFAWLISNEPFFKSVLPVISFAKLRGSYGVTGNDQIGDYGYLSTYANGVSYQGTTGLYPARIANPNYGWETNRKFEAALELGTLNDKILLTVAIYRNRSSNELVGYPLPGQTGFTSYQANLPALVQNEGIEGDLKIAGVNLGKVVWSMSLNGSINKNKLLEYPGLDQSSYATQLVIGQPLTVQLGYRFTGINPTNGVAQYQDIDHDGMISYPNDNLVIGSTSPQFFGGVLNSFAYKGLRLDIFFQYVNQQAYNLLYSPGTMVNQPISALNRWQKQGDQTAVPVPSATPGIEAFDAMANLPYSSASLSSASYVRLKNLAVSYNLPETWIKKISISSCRVYLQAQNLVTFTNYLGLDPETQGLALPPLKTLVGGIQFSF